MFSNYFLKQRTRKPDLFREPKESCIGKALNINKIEKSVKKVFSFLVGDKIKVLPLQHEYPRKAHRKSPLGE